MIYTKGSKFRWDWSCDLIFMKPPLYINIIIIIINIIIIIIINIIIIFKCKEEEE